jgi:hypothetical protein
MGIFVHLISGFCLGEWYQTFMTQRSMKSFWVGASIKAKNTHRIAPDDV